MDTKIDQLKQIIPEKYILRQEPMKNHTPFRIGGRDCSSDLQKLQWN